MINASTEIDIVLKYKSGAQQTDIQRYQGVMSNSFALSLVEINNSALWACKSISSVRSDDQIAIYEVKNNQEILMNFIPVLQNIVRNMTTGKITNVVTMNIESGNKINQILTTTLDASGETQTEWESLAEIDNTIEIKTNDRAKNRVIKFNRKRYFRNNRHNYLYYFKERALRLFC